MRLRKLLRGSAISPSGWSNYRAWRATPSDKQWWILPTGRLSGRQVDPVHAGEQAGSELMLVDNFH